jgi:hypothetical protein
MGIYTRDNLAASITPGLASALDRAAAYRARQNARIADSFKAVTDFAPVLGRTIEQGFTPDKYKDDKDYRAARYDYILNGDRSGLDRIKQAEQQASEAEKQRAFQASEAALNRALQEKEGAANRELQRQQQAHSRIMDKAKLLRDFNTYNDIIDDIDTNRAAYGVKWQIERAKAVNNRNMQKELMKSSGLFTPEELGEKPAGSVQVPFRPGYVPEAAPAAEQEGAPTETPKTKYADWMEQEPLIVSAIKNRDWATADKLMGELNPKDLGLQKDVGKYRDQVAAGRKADAAAAADAARHTKLANDVSDSILNQAVLEGKTSYEGTADGKSVTFDIKRDDSDKGKKGKYVLVYKGKVYREFYPYRQEKR